MTLLVLKRLAITLSLLLLQQELVQLTPLDMGLMHTLQFIKGIQFNKKYLRAMQIT